MKALALAGLATLACAAPARADQAWRSDLFASDAADDTWLLRSGTSFLYRFDDLQHYRGVGVETLRASIAGAPPRERQRAYYLFADGRGNWTWQGRAGTDGHTVVGSASFVHETPRRLELFVERDIVENARGLDGELYHTFAGAALDVPLGDSDRHVLTGLAGVQAFDDGNVRGHLRGRYIAVLAPEWGLSAQLRVRAFHDSAPGAADYYAPRWFAEVLPTLQWRRHFGEGWMATVAAGWGRQRDDRTPWRPARALEASLTSPRGDRDWYLRAAALYSNSPTADGTRYGYRQFTLELVRSF